MMSGLETYQGEILINGVLINKVREKDMASFRRKHMGFIFQHYNLLTALTALENAAYL